MSKSPDFGRNLSHQPRSIAGTGPTAANNADLHRTVSGHKLRATNASTIAQEEVRQISIKITVYKTSIFHGVPMESPRGWTDLAVLESDMRQHSRQLHDGVEMPEWWSNARDHLRADS